MASRCDRRMQIAALCEPTSSSYSASANAPASAVWSGQWRGSAEPQQQQQQQQQQVHRRPEELYNSADAGFGTEQGAPSFRAQGRADAAMNANQTGRTPPLPPLALARVSARRLDRDRHSELGVAAPAAAGPALGSGKAPSKKRSRRLSNSERGKLYRSRRKNYVQALEEQVSALQKEIADLSMYERTQRTSLQLTREPVSGSFARIVWEYFSLFEHGVPVVGETGDCDSNSTLVSMPREQILRSSRQASFLHSLMHPDMVFGSSYGVKTLLDQWEKYSLYHTGLKYKVDSLQIVVSDPNPVVVAPATLNVRFTRRTIEEVFPHVLWDEELVQKLIGMEVEYPVRNTFYFGADDKIHRYDTQVDFVTAFMRSLGSIKDSMTLMESAQIKHDAMLGELLEEPRPAETAVKMESRVEELAGSDGDNGGSGTGGGGGGGSDSDSGGVGAKIGMSLESIL